MPSTPLEPGVAAKRAETPADYTARLIGYLGEQDPWEILATTPERLRSIVRETPDAILRRSPEPGRWSPARIITHLADGEVVLGYRFRLILARDGVAVHGFDQDEWATHLAYDTADLEEQLSLFAAARRANLGLLRRVDPRLHRNVGMHNERGPESVEHLIRLYAGHDLNHLLQLARTPGVNVSARR